MLLVVAVLLPLPHVLEVVNAQPPAPASTEDITSCDTCSDPNVQKTGWWHGVGLNCPTGGDAGDCDICTAKHGNSPQVVAACATAQTDQDCCQLCTMWNAGRLPGGLAPGNSKPCTSWYFRKEGNGGWCGLKDCAGPGACGPAANGDNMVSGPACGTRAIGWRFVSVLLGAAFLYVGGGVVYSWKVTGQPLRFPESLPQYPMWRNIGGLVMDGVAFACSSGRRRPGGSSRSVKSSLAGSDEGPIKGQNDRLLSGDKQNKSKNSRRKKNTKGDDRIDGCTRNSRKSAGAEAIDKSASVGANPDLPQTANVAGAEGARDTRAIRHSSSGGSGRWVHVPC